MTIAILPVLLKLTPHRLAKGCVNPLHSLRLGHDLRLILYEMISGNNRLAAPDPQIFARQKTMNLPDKRNIIYHIAVGKHIPRRQRLKINR